MKILKRLTKYCAIIISVFTIAYATSLPRSTSLPRTTSLPQSTSIAPNKTPYYNISNAEGYISVENNGVTKHFIVVSSGNGIQLIPVKENPKNILKSVDKVVSNINNVGGIKNEK